jgi:hypothetical protein
VWEDFALDEFTGGCATVVIPHVVVVAAFPGIEDTVAAQGLNWTDHGNENEPRAEQNLEGLRGALAPYSMKHDLNLFSFASR